VVKVVFRFVPIVVKAPITTTAMSAAIRPYSIAVAPASSYIKVYKVASIRGPPKGLTEAIFGEKV
jgi:hypothetical protein